MGLIEGAVYILAGIYGFVLYMLAEFAVMAYRRWRYTRQKKFYGKVDREFKALLMFTKPKENGNNQIRQ